MEEDLFYSQYILTNKKKNMYFLTIICKFIFFYLHFSVIFSYEAPRFKVRLSFSTSRIETLERINDIKISTYCRFSRALAI